MIKPIYFSLPGVNQCYDIGEMLTQQNNKILPYAGGLAIIASALKATPESSGFSHALSKEYMISFICFLWIEISEGVDGKNPLFFTISVQA